MTIEELTSRTRLRLADGWWDMSLAVVSAGLLVVLALAANSLIPGWNPRTDQSRRYAGVSALRIIGMNAVALDVTASRVRAIGADPFIVVEAPATGFRVSSVEMSIRPALTMAGRDFAISFMPTKGFAGEYVSAGAASVTIVEGVQPLAPGVGYSLDRQLWIVNWTLPDPARAWRIDMPDDAEFRLEYLETYGDRGFRDVVSAAPWMAIVGSGATIAVLLVLWQLLVRPFVPGSRTIKGVLVISLVASLAIVAFVLPPFQGPDEDAHWKLGLMFYRSSIAREPAAYYLPEILETRPIRFHQGVKFQSEKLRAETSLPGLDAQAMAASHRYLLTQYSYTYVISYPVVFVTSLLFPLANTVPRALQLFYLCRIVPAILIVLLLYALNRKYELPYTAWFFFSLPLVVQQFVVISVDTLLNVGAVAAVLLFLTLRQRPSRPLTVVLWALCLTITFSKFIAGGVLLLPLLLVPYRRLPRPKLLLLLAVLASLPVIYVLGGVVLSGVRDVGRALNRAADVEQQLALLGTGVGMKTFFQAAWQFSVRGTTFEAWSGPLGWLDTPISQRHLSLVAASGLLAMFLDIWAYGSQLVRLMRTRAGEVAVLAAVAVAGLFFAFVADAVLFYLMTTPVGAEVIAGMQLRHLFPAAIVALLLPLAVLGPTAQDVGRSPARPVIIANTLALVLLPMLFFGRNLELAFDLFTRYWG